MAARIVVVAVDMRWYCTLKDAVVVESSVVAVGTVADSVTFYEM